MWEILSYLFALLPAVYVAGWGRYLLRHLDDPVFPELHLKKIRRLGTALGIGLVFSLLASNEHAVLKLALAVLGVTVADFPSRRKIFQESWGLFAYLIHGLRFWFAYFGALMLLAVLPEAVYRSGERAVPVAAALAAAILLLNHFNAWTFPRILGAVPFRHPDLEARFAAVLEKARCRAPKLWRCGPRGGNFVNAFALPSLYRPGVVFSNTLLEALGPREMTAVFAHEVGHLEHYHRWLLLRKQLGLALAVAAVLFLLFFFGTSSVVAATLTWAWPFACLVMLSRSFTRNQADEHESDLRAVELCGDHRAVADGLAKIHLLSAMPRRWAAGNERQMSHPSLAQRLRAIHEAGGVPPAPAASQEIAVRAEGDSTRAVVLAADRLHWLSGLPADADLQAAEVWRQAGDARAILYSDLADLRLDVGAFGRRRLMVTDRGGGTMKLPLQPADVAPVKAALERIDRHVLSTAPEAAPEVEAVASLPGLRLQALLAMLVALWPPFTAPLALAALLVVIRPALANLAAAGAIGTASAALGWWRPAQTWLGTEVWVLLTLAAQGLLGLIFLWQAWRRHRGRFPDPRWVAPVTIVILAAFAALSAIGLAISFSLPYPLLQVHRWARHTPALLFLLLGTAAALWTLRRWAARLPAIGLAALAAGIVFAGTAGFRERLGGDPLRTLEPRLLVQSPVLEKLRSVALESGTSRLVLSPSGARVAVATWDYDDYDEDSDYGEGEDVGLRFQIETADGGFVEVEGYLLEFLDDDRVAVLVSSDEQMRLETLSLATVAATARPEPGNPKTGLPAPESPAPEGPTPEGAEGSAPAEPEIVLPLMINPRLRLDGARWQVTGTEYDQTDGVNQSITRFSGVFGEPGFERRSWSLETGDEDFYFSSQHVSSAGRVLALGSNTEFGGWSYFALIPFLGGYAGATEVMTLGPEGQRHLFATTMPLNCFDPYPGELEFTCLASDFDSTQLWSFDPEDARFTPLGSLPGDYWQAQATGDGRLVLSGTGDPLALVDPEAGRAALIGEQIDAGSPFGAGGDALEGLEGPGRWLFEAMTRNAGAFFGSSTLAVQPGLLAVAVGNGDKTRVDVYRLMDAGPRRRE